MRLPVSIPQLCLSVSIYQLEVEFPIRYVVLSDNCCTSSPNKYNMIIIVSTSTEPTSSQRDPVHFEKSHAKRRGNQLMGNQHLQTDTHPALGRVPIWLAVHNSTTEQSLTDTITESTKCAVPLRAPGSTYPTRFHTPETMIS